MQSVAMDSISATTQHSKKITQHWQRRLCASSQPAYLLIADLIAEDIKSGRLAPKDKLPTLRVLSERLKPSQHAV